MSSANFGSVLALQILLRDRIVGGLGLPEDREDPPTFTVINELETIDAAQERFFVGLAPKRVIR